MKHNNPIAVKKIFANSNFFGTSLFVNDNLNNRLGCSNAGTFSQCYKDAKFPLHSKNNTKQKQQQTRHFTLWGKAGRHDSILMVTTFQLILTKHFQIAKHFLNSAKIFLKTRLERETLFLLKRHNSKRQAIYL